MLRRLLAPNVRHIARLSPVCCATSIEKAQLSTAVAYDALTIGVPKETFPEEKRVALTPTAVSQLIKQGFKVSIESGAGLHAKFSDDDYKKAGASIVDRIHAFGQDIVLKVRPPDVEREVQLLKEKARLISYIYPATNKDLVASLKEKKATVIGKEMD